MRNNYLYGVQCDIFIRVYTDFFFKVDTHAHTPTSWSGGMALISVCLGAVSGESQGKIWGCFPDLGSEDIKPEGPVR
jgi:hypothetical protein